MELSGALTDHGLGKDLPEDEETPSEAVDLTPPAAASVADGDSHVIALGNGFPDVKYKIQVRTSTSYV